MVSDWFKAAKARILGPDRAASTPDGAAQMPVSGELSLRADGAPLATGLFPLQQQHQRMNRAVGVSVASHVAIFLLAVFIADWYAQRQGTPFLPDLRHFDIVWVPMEGPGGGGGGGGNEIPEPPVEAELPGPDPTSVPVSQPDELENPEPEDEPEPEQEMNIPAKTLASSNQTLPGVLQGLPMALAVSLSQGLGTGGGGGTGAGTGIGPGTGSGLGPGEGGGAGGGVYRPGAGIVLPRPIREVKPQYTADAMRAKVQGSVWIEAVVTPEGTVADARITKSLDRVFGLDEEALKAARQWRFVPGNTVRPAGSGADRHRVDIHPSLTSHVLGGGPARVTPKKRPGVPQRRQAFVASVPIGRT